MIELRFFSIETIKIAFEQARRKIEHCSMITQAYQWFNHSYLT